jgi:hypothetical protein
MKTLCGSVHQELFSLTNTIRALYPGSTLQVQLQYVDDGAYRRGPSTPQLSTSFVFDRADGDESRSTAIYLQDGARTDRSQQSQDRDDS